MPNVERKRHTETLQPLKPNEWDEIDKSFELQSVDVKCSMLKICLDKHAQDPVLTTVFLF